VNHLMDFCRPSQGLLALALWAFFGAVLGRFLRYGREGDLLRAFLSPFIGTSFGGRVSFFGGRQERDDFGHDPGLYYFNNN